MRLSGWHRARGSRVLGGGTAGSGANIVDVPGGREAKLVNLAAFSGGKAMFIDVASNDVVDKYVVNVVANLVVKVTKDVVAVNTRSFLVVALRHLVGEFVVKDRFLELTILGKLAIT